MRSQHMRLNSILQEKPFYKIKRKFDKNNTNKLLYYVFIFDKKKVSQYELQENLKFNFQIFTKCQQLMPGHNLHKIKQQGTAQDGNLHVYVKPYQCRLDQYAQLNEINQYESIEIMKEVIGALYCLYKKQYFCYNVRAQNFVKVQMPNKFGNLGQQKRYRWKLNSVPFGYSYPPKTPQIRSPFTWKEQYQPPEAYTYKKKLTVDQLKQSLVWNIGCIWLQILYGKNVLNNLQNIKRFSVGSGQHGICNIESLNLKRKLSPKNDTLLSKMLAYNPKSRISLKSIFQHKVLGESINIFYYNTEISPDSDLVSEPSLAYKSKLQYDKYEQINQFIGQLVKIIDTNNLVPIVHEDSAIRVVLKRLKPKKLEELKISYTPKQTKKSKCQSQILDQNGNPSSFTADNFYKFIKPYKFYYDKTIFLSNCSKVISEKLQSIQQAKDKKKYQESILHQKNSDLIFNFQFVMISMRLIYLQTIVQNLRLYRNIFTIPDTTFNIQNPNFSNIRAQWQVFSETALYESLKLFISIKLNQCQTQLRELLEDQNSKRYSRLSDGLLSGIKNVFKDMDYKLCSIPKFLQYFQKALLNVKQVVDQFNVTNKQFKIPMNDRQGKWQQNMKNIGYLWMAIFIESSKLFSQQFYYKLFGKYMVEVKQSEISFHKINNMNLLISKQNLPKPEPLYTSQKSNQVFDFQNYQYFLRSAPSQNVKDQVQNLIRLFVV